MNLIKRHPIILVPLGLLVAFLILPFFGSKDDDSKQKPTTLARKSEKTGFLDYNLLPEKLKQRMQELLRQDSVNHYRFYYFFEVDDINHRYYLTDDERKQVVENMAVTNEEVLALVEEKLLNDQAKGVSVSFDTNFYRQRVRSRDDFVKVTVSYILPEYEADFRQLRVGIVKEGIPLALSDTFETNTTSLREVTVAPQPVRGIKYFHEVLQKSLRESLVYYQFYDLQGVVKARFTVGGQATSPQIIEGFSTREDSYEAYRLDGLVVKALNSPKIHWHYAYQNNRVVNVRVGMDFHFAFDQQGKLTVTMSDLYPIASN